MSKEDVRTHTRRIFLLHSAGDYSKEFDEEEESVIHVRKATRYQDDFQKDELMRELEIFVDNL